MTQRRRLLLVEDEPDTRAAMFHVFTQAGYSVLTADDGQQALDLLMLGVRPRLMIVDLLLPNVSGTEFLRYIQNEPDLRTIPRIVVTSLRPNEVKVIADRIFQKPADLDDVLAEVQRLAPVGTF
ncbi:MAG: response regulator [Acidobacteriota bacterium]|nr:response regulator [Acidobacteriota bacterium]